MYSRCRIPQKECDLSLLLKLRTKKTVQRNTEYLSREAVMSTVIFSSLQKTFYRVENPQIPREIMEDPDVRDL